VNGSDGDAVVAIDRATIAMGGRTILSGVDLTIGRNELIGVLGANGAGKTTLMRAILGLVPPAAGSVAVFGRPAARGNPAIGYMPQLRSAVLSGRLSGWDVVAAAASGHRWGLPVLDAAGRRDVGRVLDLVGGADLARRPLAELSGGERQRLLLAQALLGEPRLVLLDEPLISLDPHHQRGVVELVRRMQTELGITVLFSAHELNPLLGAMDRVLYLGGGQAALGAVDEVITAPVLSRLYGSPIDVVHLNGRIFVMSGDYEIDRDDHAHGHDHVTQHVH
jgi:zinc/manganese transport system ATP-binding protein